MRVEVERLGQVMVVVVLVLMDHRVLMGEVGVRYLGSGGGGRGRRGWVVEVSILQDLRGGVGQPHFSHHPQLQLVASGPAIHAGKGEGTLGHCRLLQLVLPLHHQ